MTADEIRQLNLGAMDPDGVSADRRGLVLLREIAAQLADLNGQIAELNERLKPLEIRDRTFDYPEGRP